MNKPRHDWNNTDWAQHDSALAKAMGVPVATVWRARKRAGAATLPRAKGGGRPRKSVPTLAEVDAALNASVDREIVQKFLDAPPPFTKEELETTGKAFPSNAAFFADATVAKNRNVVDPVATISADVALVDAKVSRMSRAEQRELEIAAFAAADLSPVWTKEDAEHFKPYFDKLSAIDPIREKAGELSLEERNRLESLARGLAGSPFFENETEKSMEQLAKSVATVYRQDSGEQPDLPDAWGELPEGARCPLDFARNTMHTILDAHEHADTTKAQLIQELRNEIP